ncbi:MAG: Spy/CpxP family protein refolding chaperone [Myxococcales bacterium]|nr:Spy/CpxP family protein refolding chaperone [Myxococcales bacterium]
MNKTLWIGVGATGLVLAAGAAYAAMGHGGPHGGRMMKHMISARIEDAEDYIDAAPQQRAAIEQSKDVILNAIQQRMQGHRTDHGKMIDLLAADKLDTNALYAIADQRAQDIQELAKVIVPEIQKVHDVLTPAQRQKLAARAKERQGRWHGGFGGPPEE